MSPAPRRGLSPAVGRGRPLRSGTPIASVIFTRITCPEDEREVFILSPAAVAPAHQDKGIGRALISHGLNGLRERGVEVVLTYGDVAFYSKLGFARLAEEVARAPLPLSMPEGWLGQSLTAVPLRPLRGPARCVEPLNDPAFW